MSLRRIRNVRNKRRGIYSLLPLDECCLKAIRRFGWRRSCNASLESGKVNNKHFAINPVTTRRIVSPLLARPSFSHPPLPYKLRLRAS